MVFSKEQKPVSKYKKCIWCIGPILQHGQKLYCGVGCKSSYRAYRRLQLHFHNTEGVKHEAKRIRKIKRLGKEHLKG